MSTPSGGPDKQSLSLAVDATSPHEEHATERSSGLSRKSPGQDGASDESPRGTSIENPQGVGTGATAKPASESAFKTLLCKYSAFLVDNRYFILFGSIVTIWALCGDDIRLMGTNLPDDEIFNALVIFCMGFFAFEMVLSTFGKDDYFLGFFFLLDLISTLTMILDHTAVSDYLFQGGGSGEDGDNADKARSSRTAKIGAKMGRVVRVIRLVRIVKLWKAMSQERKRRKEAADRAAGKGPKPGDFDWFEDTDDATQKAKMDPESLVGMKLSARTTQRTIILVLSCLVALPLLKVESSNYTPASAQYGADDVQEAWQRWQNGNGTQLEYEELLMKYVYYHNWFVGNGEVDSPNKNAGCSADYYSQVFWIGVQGQDWNHDQLQDIADTLPIRQQTVDNWESTLRNNNFYNYGRLPSEARGYLTSPWSTKCSYRKTKITGFSMLQHEGGHVGYAAPCPDDIRPVERDEFSPLLMTKSQYLEWHFVFYFDRRPYVRSDAMFNLITTVFICIVLCVASLMFSSDANYLVLGPVEKMIAKVEKIRDNPLSAIKMADDEFKIEERAKAQSAKRTLKEFTQVCSCRRSTDVLLETVILEKTIIKLGSLLALGFGEAGMGIVSHNMAGSSSAGVNAMVTGSRVDCVIGYARIHDFSTVTEVLQGKVMTFVNQICEIVHGVVDEFSGAANKNNGDTFLCIWKTQFSAAKDTKLAEMSILAFAQILCAIHQSKLLATYRFHPGLQQRLRSNCRVHISFGLHYGWAIEGAVGSEFKIDASYLSPNVSIAASIEQATMTYGVPLLMSQAVADLCTKDLKAEFRLIDKVVIQGSREPVELHSVDLDYLALEVDSEVWKQPVWNSQQRFRSRQILEQKKESLWDEKTSMASLFKTIPDFQLMRRRYTVEFMQLFYMGYQNYSQGEWATAQRMLLGTNTMLGCKDGPSGALLRFMEMPHGFKAPAGWQGQHPLQLGEGASPSWGPRERAESALTSSGSG